MSRLPWRFLGALDGLAAETLFNADVNVLGDEQGNIGPLDRTKPRAVLFYLEHARLVAEEFARGVVAHREQFRKLLYSIVLLFNDHFGFPYLLKTRLPQLGARGAVMVSCFGIF